MSKSFPSGDRPFRIEVHGTDPIPEEAAHGKPSELFWIWFGANLSIFAIIYGIILSGAGLNFWQSILVLLIGTVSSFLLVALLSLAGVWGRRPMLALSRAPFGRIGNIGPALLSWLSLVGWEIVGVVLAAYVLLDALQLLGLASNMLVTALSVLLTTALIVAAGVLGHATLVRLQQFVTIVFGLLTFLIGGFLLIGTNWSAALSAPAGPWVTGVLATLSIIAAGTGLSWLNVGADYTRYLPRNSSQGAILWWTISGSLLPFLVLGLVGFLLAGRVPGLADAENPVAAIGAILPSWMAIPFLLTAYVSLLAAAYVVIYSSGLSLLATGLRIPRYRSVLIDGSLIVIGAIYIMFIAKDFLGVFESFLGVISVGLTAWAGVFLIAMLQRRLSSSLMPEPSSDPLALSRRAVEWTAVGSWVVGSLVGLLFTSSPLFTGPLAVGILASSNFGYVFSFVISLLLYLGLLEGTRRFSGASFSKGNLEKGERYSQCSADPSREGETSSRPA